MTMMMIMIMITS